MNSTRYGAHGGGEGAAEDEQRADDLHDCDERGRDDGQRDGHPLEAFGGPAEAVDEHLLITVGEHHHGEDHAGDHQRDVTGRRTKGSIHRVSSSAADRNVGSCA